MILSGVRKVAQFLSYIRKFRSCATARMNQNTRISVNKGNRDFRVNGALKSTEGSSLSKLPVRKLNWWVYVIFFFCSSFAIAPGDV